MTNPSRDRAVVPPGVSLAFSVESAGLTATSELASPERQGRRRDGYNISVGAGDGVMIAGDVRTLARGYCANGTKVYYEHYDALSHITSVAVWLPNSIAWITERFKDLPAPQNCSSIQPGNPLEPIPMPSPQVVRDRHQRPSLC